jgi:capsular polysaccharide transport system ATP-binding protein
MWGFVNCTRYYLSFGVPKVVLYEASLVVETTEKLALLVPAGEGKSTIVRLLAGVDQPDSGHVLRDKRGWPLGYAGAFQAELTGEENIHNIAAMIGLDPLSYSAFCAEFSELGEAYFHPIRLYTGRMRGQLAFAASFGIPARTYLADDRIVAGDEHFKAKCAAAVKAKLETAGLIFVASHPRATEKVCERFAVVSGGKIIACRDYEEATEIYAGNFLGVAGDELADEELASFDLA